MGRTKNTQKGCCDTSSNSLFAEIRGLATAPPMVASLNAFPLPRLRAPSFVFIFAQIRGFEVRTKSELAGIPHRAGFKPSNKYIYISATPKKVSNAHRRLDREHIARLCWVVSLRACTQDSQPNKKDDFQKSPSV